MGRMLQTKARPESSTQKHSVVNARPGGDVQHLNRGERYLANIMFWSKAKDGLSCVEIAALLHLQDVFVEVGSVSTGDVINIREHERALPVKA